MSNILNKQGRALVPVRDMPEGTEIRRAPGPVRVVSLSVDDKQVIIKDRGYCIVARVFHADGTSTRHTSPIGVTFQHKGLHITKATTPRSARQIALRAAARGRKTW